MRFLSADVESRRALATRLSRHVRGVLPSSRLVGSRARPGCSSRPRPSRSMANKCLWLLVAAASVALLLIHGHRRRRSLRAAKRTAAISELLASDMRTLASEMRSPPPPPLVSPPPPLTSPPPPPPLASSPPPRDSYHADPSCHPTQHAGFNGGSLNWGMSFKVYTAQECCDACKAHARICVPGSGGTVYFRRITWEGKTVDERCAGSMNSNEHGSAKAQPQRLHLLPDAARRGRPLLVERRVESHVRRVLAEAPAAARAARSRRVRRVPRRVPEKASDGARARPVDVGLACHDADDHSRWAEVALVTRHVRLQRHLV